MAISIIVVTWNNETEIRACLDAALTQREVDADVIVVDNASTDSTRHILDDYRDRVRIVAMDHNSGYAAANSLAARQSTGELLLLLNPDCTMDPDCAATLADHLAATPACGVAAAMLRYPDGRPQAFARREITLRSAWWCLTEMGSRWDVKRLRGRHRLHRWYADGFAGSASDAVTVDTAAAACVMLRRRDVEGELFDDRFPLLYNDSDLYRRLRLRGLSAQVVPAAGAVHHYGTGLARVPAARMRAEAVRSLLRYADRWWSPAGRVGLRLALLLDCFGCAVLIALRRRPQPARVALRGTWGGLGLPGGARPWLATEGPQSVRPARS